MDYRIIENYPKFESWHDKEWRKYTEEVEKTKHKLEMDDYDLYED